MRSTGTRRPCRSAALDTVKADSRVAFVSPDREVHITAQALPTGINRIDADTSSTLAGNGSGSVNINVAVIDTGINVSHPDLNVVGGRDCAPGLGYEDGNGHGSHVAGTIAAKDDANGVVGVAPGARLYAVKVLNDAGIGLTSDIVCGINWVTSTRTDADPNNNIAVANMSLGGGGSDDGNCGNSNADAEHLAICNSVNAGVTYVVAAGNDGVNYAELDAGLVQRGAHGHGDRRLQRPAGRGRRQHVPQRRGRPVRELQQLRRAGRRPEPHDRGAGRLHPLDVPARHVRQHALGDEHGLAARRGHGRALHRDGRLHGRSVCGDLEAANRRPDVQPGNDDLRIQRRPGPSGQRPLLRLAGSRRRLLNRTEDE